MTDSSYRYSSTVEFDQKKITRLTRVQFYSKTLWRDVLTVLCAAALLAVGVGTQRGIISTFALAMGAFMVISIFSRESSLAKDITRRYDGAYPMIFYYFSDEGIRSSKLKEIMPYTELNMLIHDREYLFLFKKDGSALMVEKKSVEGEDGADGLMRYIAGASSLKWESLSKLFAVSVKSSLSAWRSKSKEEYFSGERLG